jgi:hypothetical protein
MQQLTDTVDLLADVVAERAGLPAGNFSARVLAGAVIGAVIAAMPGGLMSDYDIADLGRIDEAFTPPRSGLPLSPDDAAAGSGPAGSPAEGRARRGEDAVGQLGAAGGPGQQQRADQGGQGG